MLRRGQLEKAAGFSGFSSRIGHPPEASRKGVTCLQRGVPIRRGR
jgi:hypothetical protein